MEREYNGFLDEFDEQELYDIVVAMEDYASQQVKILPIADVVGSEERTELVCGCSRKDRWLMIEMKMNFCINCKKPITN